VAEVDWEPDVPEPNEDAVDVARRDKLLEILVVVMLSLASLLTAWGTYEAASWAGEQSDLQSRALAQRLDASRAENNADQLMSIDINLFANYLAAYSSGDTKLATFYVERFRDEFRPAFDAWLADEPLTNLDAPNSPFSLPEYRLASREQADTFEAQAESLFDQAIDANSHSEAYILTTVVLALVLFLGGVSSRIVMDQARFSLIAVAGLLLVIGFVRLLSLPLA